MTHLISFLFSFGTRVQQTAVYSVAGGNEVHNRTSDIATSDEIYHKSKKQMYHQLRPNEQNERRDTGGGVKRTMHDPPDGADDDSFTWRVA